MAGLAQIHALGTKLVAVKHDFSLGLVELHIGISVDEHAAGEGLLHELVGEVPELLRFGRRSDHEIDREVTTPGQWRRSEWNDPNTWNPDNGPWIQAASCCAVFLRSLQGLVTMPPKPPLGFVS